ncbi:MAG: sucrase ferredoxin, partial [Cyanobacteria bacterium P01_F01_bin.86]
GKGVRSQELGVRSQELGVRSQELEGRGQESEVGSQELGVRSQELEGRGQESGVRSQESEGSGQESGVRSQESEFSELRVWRCSHFGGHQFAPTLIDLPEGRYWGHVEPAMLDRLVYRNGTVTELRSHYRGWAGLSKFEQVAEREIWMQEGWDWLTRHKSGKTLRKGLTGIKRYVYPLLKLIPLKRVQFFLEQWTREATWAEVQIRVAASDQSSSTVYTAQVEVSGQVMSAVNSPQAGERVELRSVPQYRVSRLVKQ